MGPRLGAALWLLMAACGSPGMPAGDGGPGGGGADADPGDPNPDQLVTYGTPYTGGQFHLGPVDWDETQWHNACAPAGGYAPAIRDVEGVYLAGLWNGIPDVASYCDACIYVQTDLGKSALLRVVTYGDTAPNSIDVSPEAFAILDSGESPRTMTWQLAECNDTGPMRYEFQTGSNPYWTSLWVRNARVPVTSVAVTSPNHASFFDLTRGGDGTLTDAGGFGTGDFTIRVTGVDGQHVDQAFPWPSGGIAGALLTGGGNFP
jgi:expansin (peptidoglycan-binding protein)